jgi:hypothetical protein
MVKYRMVEYYLHGQTGWDYRKVGAVDIQRPRPMSGREANEIGTPRGRSVYVVKRVAVR